MCKKISSNFYKIKLVAAICLLISAPPRLYASDIKEIGDVGSDPIPVYQPQDNTGSPPTSRSATETTLSLPLIVEFYNGAGYSAWYVLEWIDPVTQQEQKRVSGTTASGQYVRYEVPRTTLISSIRVQGFSNTGILWSKYRQAFDITLDRKRLYTWKSRMYYGILTRGTTLDPYGVEYKPQMGIDGLDPYSDKASDCARMGKLVLPPFAGLVNPADQYNLENQCSYEVRFTFATSLNRFFHIDVGAKQTAYWFPLPGETPSPAVINKKTDLD